jgi:hypothetical protein
MSKKDHRSPHRSSNVIDIFVPAPEGLSKEKAFDYHITTRNVFAFCCDRPLVGNNLGKAMIELQDRLLLWRPRHPANLDDFRTYVARQGYLEFAHCPDYSIALLRYAEQFRTADIWIDAFTHCVGMHDMLYISKEYEV